jgi:vitamin K-dependent gamma-carboxylase
VSAPVLLRSATARLFRPADPAGLAAFRILFGILMLASALRFFWNGWIDAFFVEPTFHFKYWGFGWVKAWPAWGLHLHFALLALLSLLIALGLFYRVAIVLYFLLFTYLQLIDVTLYLNHYYLVGLLALLLCFLPANAAFSLDARLWPGRRRPWVPELAYLTLRFQVAVVYTCAGLAKLQPDWLVEAQPLSVWLASFTDLPVLGPLLAHPLAPRLASWGGFLFDGTVALFLAWRPSRPFAFAAVIVFHLLTAMFFPIGMFPAIMIVAATVFFAPCWPRRLLPGLATSPTPLATTTLPGRGQRLALAGLAAYVLVQLVLPFRHLAYGGNVLWHEQGMRFSWRVMVREKNASLTYHVRAPVTGRTWEVSPRDYLVDYQERDMSTQPDLIWQLAQRIGQDFDARGQGRVEVRAEVYAALNGRPAAPLVDPRVNLREVEDSLGAKSWILPAPARRPRRMMATR